MAALVRATRDVLERTGVAGNSVAALALNTTGSSVIPVDRTLQPLDDYLLWCDHRAHLEAKGITALAHAVGLDVVNVIGTSTCIIAMSRETRLVPGVCGVACRSPGSNRSPKQCKPMKNYCALQGALFRAGRAESLRIAPRNVLPELRRIASVARRTEAVQSKLVDS